MFIARAPFGEGHPAARTMVSAPCTLDGRDVLVNTLDGRERLSLPPRLMGGRGWGGAALMGEGGGAWVGGGAGDGGEAALVGWGSPRCDGRAGAHDGMPVVVPQLSLQCDFYGLR